MTIGICLTVKNEAPYLAEWITFHSRLGVNHIWIYDNNSKDQLQGAVREFSAVTELISWPQIPAFPANISDCLARAQGKGIDWLALVDADEFIVPVDGRVDSLKNVILKAECEGLDQLWIPIYFYSSSNHLTIPEGRVIDNYQVDTKRKNTKAIVRVSSKPRPYSTHRFKTEAVRTVYELRINHYHNKSKEDLLIRQQKGFVDEWGWKNLAREGEIQRVWDWCEKCEKGFPSKNHAACSLSALFKTPGTQTQLAIEPIRVVILTFGSFDGSLLRSRLSPCFRDVTLLNVDGSAAQDPQSSYPSDVVFHQLESEMDRCDNAQIVFFIPADVCLQHAPSSYKNVLLAAFPFDIWHPAFVADNLDTSRSEKGEAVAENLPWAVSSERKSLALDMLKKFIAERTGSKMPTAFASESSLKSRTDSTVSSLEARMPSHMESSTYWL